MKVCVIGSGYVGLVTGACLARVGHTVVCVDDNEHRVSQLTDGHVPIYEPGLESIVNEARSARRLSFETSDKLSDVLVGCDVAFIAVGTPPAEDGSADVHHVLAAAYSVGKVMSGQLIIVNKSTVPVGTAERVAGRVHDALRERNVDIPFDVVSNPEFLKEGCAVQDFMKPDRIILGTENAVSERKLRQLYAPFNRNHDRVIVMSVRSAELTKYAANSMLAMRISFMNEIAAISERVGADVESVRIGMGSDPRIGWHFLYPGCGYGGSCFPKDVQALIKLAESCDVQPTMLRATELVNERQKLLLINKIVERFGALRGLTFTVWGLAFKPNTDDVRAAPAIEIVRTLARKGAKVRVYDPEALFNAREELKDVANVFYFANKLVAAYDSNAIIVCTEWDEFRYVDFADLAALSDKVLFDGRNIYDPKSMADAGWEYHCIGRPLIATETV